MPCHNFFEKDISLQIFYFGNFLAKGRWSDIVTVHEKSYITKLLKNITYYASNENAKESGLKDVTCAKVTYCMSK